MYSIQTREALAAISALHRYAAEQLVATLAYAPKLAKAATNTTYLTPLQTIMLDRLNHGLIRSVLATIQRGDGNVVDALCHQAPLGKITLEAQRQIDQLIQVYVQRVHIMLWR